MDYFSERNMDTVELTSQVRVLHHVPFPKKKKTPELDY